MTTTTTYDAPGVFEFVVPAGVTSVAVDATGGAGSGFDIGATGGIGGRVRATLTVVPGERLLFTVGGNGDEGGYNGGGRTGTSSLYGGGATDVRRGGSTLAHRVLVAAGGGSVSTGVYDGGNGGGLVGSPGEDAPNRVGGTGGTQSAGGTVGGVLGQGGRGGEDESGNAGGGGGGGYYGGGAGGAGFLQNGFGNPGAGGGGGSSLVPAGGITSTGLTRNATLTITYDRPPTTPDRLTPPAGSALARQDRNRLSWRHNDPDGDGQDAYVLDLLAPGASTWQMQDQVQSPNTHHDLDTGMAAGVWQWRVWTINAAGISPPSQASSFVMADRAPGPTWLDPINGQAVPRRTYTLRWSGTGVQYRVRSVRDAGGVRDDTVEYGRAEGATTTRELEWTFPVNGRTEWLLVEEADANGLWSSVGAARVPVSYTLPARALVALSGDLALLALAVQIVTPAASNGRPGAASHTVRVRPVGDSGDGTLVASDVPRNALVLYRFAAFGVEYEVLVSTMGENGAVDSGAWTATSTAVGGPTTPTDPDDPTGTALYGTALYGTALYG